MHRALRTGVKWLPEQFLGPSMGHWEGEQHAAVRGLLQGWAAPLSPKQALLL